MQVQLSERSREFVERQLQSGRFASAEDVLETVIQWFADCRFAETTPIDPETGRPLTNDELRALIQEGLDDEAAGRYGPLDLQEIKREIREELSLTSGVNRAG